MLKKFDVPYFHSKEFFNRTNSGQRLVWYKHWSDKKANFFIGALAKLIHLSPLWPIGAVVHLADFNSLSYGEKKHYTGGLFDGHKWYATGAPSKPYYLAMMLSWREAFQRANSDTEVHFLYEHQQEYESGAYHFFYHSKQVLYKEFSDKMGHIGFADKQKFVGLQAADLLAYSWNNYLTRRVERLRTDSIETLMELTQKRDSFPIANAEYFETQRRLQSEVQSEEWLTALINTPKPSQPRLTKGRNG